MADADASVQPAHAHDVGEMLELDPESIPKDAFATLARLYAAAAGDEAAAATVKTNNDVAWSRVTLTVVTKTSRKRVGMNPVSRVETTKKVLDDVSGHARAGEVTAVVGPPKAGKSALIKVLSGRLRMGRLAGTVSSPAPLGTAGFVPFAEALAPTETVAESIAFSARLRRRVATRDEAKAFDQTTAELVSDLCRSFGLNPNDRVGKLPASAKKRVGVAVELAALPLALFLDEPVSPITMDSVEAWTTIRLLKLAAAAARIPIVCTMREPASEVFAELGHIVFLSLDGRVAYTGLATGLDAALAQAGLVVPPRTNPSDFAVLALRRRKWVLAPSSAPSASASGDDPEAGSFRLALTNNSKSVTGGSSSGGLPSTTTENKINLADVDLDSAGARTNSKRVPSNPVLRYFAEVAMLLRRHARVVARDRSIMGQRIGLHGFVATLLAVILMHQGDQSKPTYTMGSHFGSVVLAMLSSTLLTASGGVALKAAERPRLIRELCADTYSIPAYLTAEFLVDTPLNLFSATLWIVIISSAVGWAGRLGFYIGTLLLVMETAFSLGRMLVFLNREPGKAVAMTPGLIASEFTTLYDEYESGGRWRLTRAPSPNVVHGVVPARVAHARRPRLGSVRRAPSHDLANKTSALTRVAQQHLLPQVRRPGLGHRGIPAGRLRQHDHLPPMGRLPRHQQDRGGGPVVGVPRARGVRRGVPHHCGDGVEVEVEECETWRAALLSPSKQDTNPPPSGSTNAPMHECPTRPWSSPRPRQTERARTTQP